MENSSSIITVKEPKNTAILSRNERKTQKNSDSGNAGQESSAIVRCSRRQERHRRSRRSKRSTNAAVMKKMTIKEEDTSANTTTTGEEDEKVEVENKIMALQKIVPGGESLGVDKLFEETAEYILELQYQVKALKFLASFVEGTDKEKRRFGG